MANDFTFAVDTRRRNLRVAIAHDWLLNYAGSERVVAALAAMFPQAEIVTTLLDEQAVPHDLARARPSFLQHVPGSRRYHEWFVPVMPIAWWARPQLRNIDVLISSSHACAQAVRAARGIPHLCYCHTPMRYAWSFSSEKQRFPWAIRGAANAGMGVFRRWDRRNACAVTRFLANSASVASRIKLSYGREAFVVHPPVRTTFFTPGTEPPEDFFLYVGRLVAYKRPDLLIEAFADLPYPLVVVGDGKMKEWLRAHATPNVRFLGRVADLELRDLYRRARALVFPGLEDFGISMAEAQACGLPVIGRRAGGALDIVGDGETGWLLDDPSPRAIRRAVNVATREVLDRNEIARRSKRFSYGRFRREVEAHVDDLVAP
jgi:glycosyltransferase involved in cell wall biosynthesis